METCRHGHPWTPQNTVFNSAGYRVCRACRRMAGVKSQRKYNAARFSPSQMTLLRQAAFGFAADDWTDLATVRALARRGLIYRSAGRYQLTEAGEQALAGLTVPAPQ
jgi:hypothetical protein